ncbi:MAG: hypothetical protein KDC80_28425 [Saprospiraceae bacterium]|nr:hypothetical protein [Saprospiraceae bacterium]
MKNHTLHQLIEDHPQVPFFLKPSWMEVVCPGEWDLIAQEKDGKLQAFIPFRLRNKWGYRIVTTPYLTPHSGPWIAEGMDPKLKTEAYKAIAKKISEYSYLNLKLEAAEDYFFAWSSSRVKMSLIPTFILKTNSISEYEKGISKRKLQKIRELRNKLKLSPFDTNDLIKALKSSYAHQGSKLPFAEKLIHEVVDFICLYNHGEVLGIKDNDGSPISGILYVEDNCSYYSLLRGQNYDCSNLPGLLFLQDMINQKAVISNQKMDFCGSQNKGIAMWNSQFGPTVNYFLSIRKPIQNYFSELSKTLLTRFKTN